MKTVEQWVFSEAILCEDGKYKVTGRCTSARSYYGEPRESGIGFDWNGMLIGPVIGYGISAQAARDVAIYLAGCQDGVNKQIMQRASYDIMGGIR